VRRRARSRERPLWGESTCLGGGGEPAWTEAARSLGGLATCLGGGGEQACKGRRAGLPGTPSRLGGGSEQARRGWRGEAPRSLETAAARLRGSERAAWEREGRCTERKNRGKMDISAFAVNLMDGKLRRQ
jgi:hypothetical protein